MWRPELLHVLCLHLPLVTLPLATIAWVLRRLVQSASHRLFLGQLLMVMLVIGVPAAWIAIYTGENAYNVVVRTICDPPVLQAHQWWSYASAITYSVTLAFLLGERWVPSRLKRLSGMLAGVMLMAGASGLIYSGHLGASVVYQQGGGTYKPSVSCEEFSE